MKCLLRNEVRPERQITRRSNKSINQERTMKLKKRNTMKNEISIAVLTLAFAACCVTVARADQFSFSTGSPDGKLGALSRPAGSQGLETETADDFVLTQPTVISSATMHGLLIP